MPDQPRDTPTPQVNPPMGEWQSLPEDWSTALLDLAQTIRSAVRLETAQTGSRGPGQEWVEHAQVQPVGQGMGDVTFAPDQIAERCIDSWSQGIASQRALSILTEDRGWRHLGPDPQAAGGWRELKDFCHGGPRLIIDPIDGTRPWMHGIRPAWCSIAACGPGSDLPFSGEVLWACLEEIPPPRAGWARCLVARQGQGCQLFERALYDGLADRARVLRCADAARVDHGVFAFFAFHPAIRSEAQARALRFFARLEEYEGAAIEHCYDDQYTSSAGQLALLALGHYQMVCDMRPWLTDRAGSVTQCAKPYDVAAALLCAREAGALVTDLKGTHLTFPCNLADPVGFIGYPGPQSRERLERHWLALRDNP